MNCFIQSTWGKGAHPYRIAYLEANEKVPYNIYGCWQLQEDSSLGSWQLQEPFRQIRRLEGQRRTALGVSLEVREGIEHMQGAEAVRRDHGAHYSEA